MKGVSIGPILSPLGGNLINPALNTFYTKVQTMMGLYRRHGNLLICIRDIMAIGCAVIDVDQGADFSAATGKTYPTLASTPPARGKNRSGTYSRTWIQSKTLRQRQSV
jgi:hypothetical protein